MTTVAVTPPKARKPFSIPRMKLSVVCRRNASV